MIQAKYRPYLSIDECRRILERLDRSDIMDATIYANIAMLIFKIENGFNTASYHTNPRKTIEEKLELDDDEQENIMAKIAAGIGKKS